MPARWVDFKVGNQTMDGYLAQPEAAGKYPAVLVIQEVWGANSHIQSIADRLPSQGYVALAPSIFHREGKMLMGLHEERDTAMARMGKCTDANIVADVKAAVDYLKAQPFVRPDRIGIVGFCFGGRVAYLAATAVPDLKASVVYYGGRILQALGGDGPSPLQQTSKINAAVLGLFGETDQNPTPADVAKIEAELKAHRKTYEFHMYPGCGHGFHCDSRASFRPEAAQNAWSKTLAWFEKYLKA